ncbi:MAG: hypothetical protein PVG07_00335 [Acidobacteriota bacterium]|jgi:hypothetical protein
MLPRPLVLSLLLALCVLCAGAPAAALQDGPSGSPEQEEAAERSEPAEAEAPEREDAPSGVVIEEEDRTLLPELNVYFPEGELDLRVNRLVRKVFVEGQVKYNFVDGDISAFLRYRYYGYKRTYQLSVFDEVEFEDIEEFSNDFDRTRGVLLLTQWPQSFHRRAFLLTELDRITSNKRELFFDTGKTNLFMRLGYQIGTPNDDRSNAIVGEDRARLERLFTAFRKIGPGDAGLTGALTWGTDLALGDFDYTKLEVAGIKRFELPRGAFLFGRAHAGTFPDFEILDRDLEEDPRLPSTGRFSIPREEFFRLDGRDNLKGLDERLRGTDEIHFTVETLFPWFVDQRRRFLKLDWRNWYWVLYAGTGNIGFDSDIYTELGDYVYDVGVGMETSFTLREFEFFLSGLVADSFNTEEGGVTARFSLKSYH